MICQASELPWGHRISLMWDLDFLQFNSPLCVNPNATGVTHNSLSVIQELNVILNPCIFVFNTFVAWKIKSYKKQYTSKYVFIILPLFLPAHSTDGFPSKSSGHRQIPSIFKGGNYAHPEAVICMLWASGCPNHANDPCIWISQSVHHCKILFLIGNFTVTCYCITHTRPIIYTCSSLLRLKRPDNMLIGHSMHVPGWNLWHLGDVSKVLRHGLGHLKPCIIWLLSN